ncbi:unnamed protein product [Hymenolepis diminuta]|uniref:Uncharacterized protein n=1 Tax=Hymenolepis diminuta TaxID=6216 RepID=A0A3P6ZQM2_HYMDI|nr:unnamed protein product [Hymenolepis diminuta]
MTNQTTLLMEAARRGYAKILAILLDHGASLHAKDTEGNFAIHYAAENGRLKCLQLLMSKGSLAIVGNLSFKTPLMKAAENGHADVVTYLIENGVKITCMLNKNSESELTLAANSNKLEVVKILLNPLYARPYIDRSDELNYVLRLAVEKKNVELAELLLEAGADPNYVNSDDYPCLFTAIDNGDLEMVKSLISYGAYINLLNWDDVTPLMAAIETGNVEIVEYITLAGKFNGVVLTFKALKSSHIFNLQKELI